MKKYSTKVDHSAALTTASYVLRAVEMKGSVMLSLDEIVELAVAYRDLSDYKVRILKSVRL